MLVLRQVYKLKNDVLVPCSYIILNLYVIESYSYNELYFLMPYEMTARFDVFDTETNTLRKMLSLDELKEIKDIVFGVFEYGTGTVCMSVSSDVWKFLDLIDEPVNTKKSVNDLLEGNYNLIERPDFRIIDYGSKVKYVFSKFFVPDKNGIFWVDRKTNVFVTILDLYRLLFDKIESDDLNKDLELYIQRYTNSLIKLDVNREVIRFIVKLKVLR